MMSRHFRLNSELSGAIAKRLPHAKKKLSVTYRYIYIYIYIRVLQKISLNLIMHTLQIVYLDHQIVFTNISEPVDFRLLKCIIS